MDLREKFKLFNEQTAADASTLNTFNGKVLLVDGLNQFIRCFAATPTMNEVGDHFGGVTGFLNSIAMTIRNFKPTRVVIVFDGKGGSLRRRALYPEYKANRKMMVRLNRTYDFQSLEEEQNARKKQLMLLVELLRCLPLTVMAPENVEADDAIAYLARYVAEIGGKAIIMSSDKDFLQMVDDKISVWNPIQKKMFKPEGVIEKYGIHPRNFLLYRVMTGDASDNIPGIRGVKEKTFKKLFPQVESETPVSLTEIIDQAAQKKKSKVCATIAESRELMERNMELMRLDDVAMSGTTRISVLNQFDANIPSLNKYRLTQLLIHDRLIGTFGNFDEWVVKSFAPLMRFSNTTDTP